MNALVRHLRTQHRSLPVSYLCFDCETTGLSHKFDLPIELGHEVVKNQKGKGPKSLILDWTRCPDFVDQTWLRETLEEQADMARLRGDTYHFSVKRMKKEGRDPEIVLEHYLRLFEKVRARGWGFVGHNAVSFDAKLLHLTFENVLDEVFYFAPDELFDTGCLHKAAVLKLRPTMDEPLADFFRRAQYAYAPGLKWNVRHCAEVYLPAETIDLTKTHQAGYDAHICHLLFESYRSKSGGKKQLWL